MQIVWDGRLSCRLIPQEEETQEEICLAVAVAASKYAIRPARIFPPVGPKSTNKDDYRRYLRKDDLGTGIRLESHEESLFAVYVAPQTDGSLLFNEIAYINRAGNSGRGMLPQANRILQQWKESAA